MTETCTTQKRFPLGRIVITSNALDRINPHDVAASLRRHAHGDWGDLDVHDVQLNELSLKEGSRLLSVYADREGVKFWIITEADRTLTTILLPEDY